MEMMAEGLHGKTKDFREIRRIERFK